MFSGIFPQGTGYANPVENLKKNSELAPETRFLHQGEMASHGEGWELTPDISTTQPAKVVAVSNRRPHSKDGARHISASVFEPCRVQEEE